MGNSCGCCASEGHDIDTYIKSNPTILTRYSLPQDDNYV